MKKNSKLDDWFSSLLADACPSIDVCIAMLERDLPWLGEMEKTPQDPQWHGEGNVKIHSGMVLKEIYALLQSDAKHLPPWKRQVLILSAILHDIGKTVTTKESIARGKMRWVSPRHEEVGRSYLAFKIMAWNLEFRVIHAVLNIVGEHHMPRRLILRDLPKGDYLRVARKIDMELLYFFEIADMRGRICEDLDRQLLHMEEFKLFSEEYGVWKEDYTHSVREKLSEGLQACAMASKSYAFSKTLHHLEVGKIHMPEEGLSSTYAHREEHAELVILCGPSGSGKSTFIGEHLAGFSVVSLDDLREKINGKRANQKHRGEILRQAKEELKVQLRKKAKVVWDATNLRRDFREVLTRLGRDYHAMVTLIVFLVPEETLFQHNRKRKHQIPEDILLKQIDSYQFPENAEGDRYMIVDRSGEMVFRDGFWQ